MKPTAGGTSSTRNSPTAGTFLGCLTTTGRGRTPPRPPGAPEPRGPRAAGAGPAAVAVHFRRNSDTESDRVSFSPLPLLEHLVIPKLAATVADVEDDNDDDGLWMRWPVGSEMEKPPPRQQLAAVRIALPSPSGPRKQSEPRSPDETRLEGAETASARTSIPVQGQAEADAGSSEGRRFNLTNPFHLSISHSDRDDGAPSSSLPRGSSTNPFWCDSGVSDPRTDDLVDVSRLWSWDERQPSPQEQSISEGQFFEEEEGNFEVSARNSEQCCSTDSFISVNLSEPEEDTRYLLNKK